MSGRYDDFVQRAGLVSTTLLEHRFKIRVCRDRTLSITDNDETPFNGVAIAVYSTRTREEAEDLILTLGSLQYIPHPLPYAQSQMPYGQWRKITLDSEPFAQEFEYVHLVEIQEKLLRVAEMIRARRDMSAA